MLETRLVLISTGCFVLENNDIFSGSECQGPSPNKESRKVMLFVNSVYFVKMSAREIAQTADIELEIQTSYGNSGLDLILCILLTDPCCCNNRLRYITVNFVLVQFSTFVKPRLWSVING